MLQWAVDMGAAARAMHDSLDEQGVVLASLFSAGSLGQLADAWTAVDSAPHMVALPEPEAVQAAFESNGFQLTWQQPFTAEVYFDSLADIRQHLRGLGATNAVSGRAKGLMSRAKLQRLQAALETFRTAQGIPMTWNAWLFKAEKK